MGRKNENTVSVKLVSKVDKRNNKTSQFYQVIANKSSTTFKVKKIKGRNSFTLVKLPIELPIPEVLEKIVAYEYNLIGEQYKPSGIHHRLQYKYLVTFEKALYKEILAHTFFLFIEKNISKAQKKILSRVNKGEPHLFASKYTNSIDPIASLWNTSLILDDSPRNFLSPTLLEDFSFGLNVTHFFNEAEREDKYRYMYEWLFNRDNIISLFKSFLARKREKKVNPQNYYTQVVFNYLDSEIGQLIYDRYADKDIVEYFVEEIDTWAEATLRVDQPNSSDYIY